MGCVEAPLKDNRRLPPVALHSMYCFSNCLPETKGLSHVYRRPYHKKPNRRHTPRSPGRRCTPGSSPRPTNRKVRHTHPSDARFCSTYSHQKIAPPPASTYTNRAPSTPSSRRTRRRPSGPRRTSDTGTFRTRSPRKESHRYSTPSRGYSSLGSNTPKERGLDPWRWARRTRLSRRRTIDVDMLIQYSPRSIHTTRPCRRGPCRCSGRGTGLLRGRGGSGSASL